MPTGSTLQNNTAHQILSNLPPRLGNLGKISWKRKQKSFSEEVNVDDGDFVLCIIDILDAPSEFKQNVLYYISGFVAKKVAISHNCDECKMLLFTTDDCIPVQALFTRRKGFVS